MQLRSTKNVELEFHELSTEMQSPSKSVKKERFEKELELRSKNAGLNEAKTPEKSVEN